MRGITDRYSAIQQDVLETFVDRGQLTRLRLHTIITDVAKNVYLRHVS
jgi:hypothetical protein